jgi:urease beta subunit
MSKLRITPADGAYPVDDEGDRQVATAFHFHLDQVNVAADHKHECARGDSFSCDECGKYIRDAQKANPDNYVGWKVEKA